VKATSSPLISLALHFRYIERGQLVSSSLVAVRLLARVLWAVKPCLLETGSLVVRMEKLFYTQHLGGKPVAAWSRSLEHCIRWPRVDVGDLGELDRIFVVVLSGRLGNVAEALCRRVDRPRPYPLLFGLLVDSSDAAQTARYLSAYSTPIGVLHTDASLELAFSAIEYHPEIERMFSLMRMQAPLSRAALVAVRRLLD
jgi:hypothetical protein